MFLSSYCGEFDVSPNKEVGKYKRIALHSARFEPQALYCIAVSFLATKLWNLCLLEGVMIVMIPCNFVGTTANGVN